MNSISVAHEANRSESKDLITWSNQMYNELFAKYFSEIRGIRDRLSANTPISDFDIERILTEFPLDLFSVSEALNQFKLEYELNKLKLKEARRNQADADTLAELEILNTAYSTLISRVETEISFSRELIMGVKKIWDGRRSTEKANPIGEELPEYVPDQPSRRKYIK